ncbi:uncharacterized protein C8A04DRAFT_37718 [Dichotomopilus funicola]|uniref:Nephrocystin 3-like N-terminal domain-containing protein n=1 Tax=Dichotomopilus funicola TaxID=1934379 RepID=A0AAN6ZN38_9PEZI|nr:hypothetical protein C8A04DRAFT_37718 [Dichotomopilus funicola]
MEAVALASTFATLIGFTIQLYGICRYYVDAARGACPHDFKLVLIETSSLQAMLESVKVILDASENRREDEANLQKQIGDTVSHCTTCIKELLSLMPEPLLDGRGKMTMKDKATIIAKAVRWGASNKKGRCDTLLNDLSKYKANLGLGLTVGLSHEVKQIRTDVTHVRSSINTMQAHLDATQRSEVYRWLEQNQINPSSLHNAAIQLHESRTGQWIFGSNEWKAWADGPEGTRRLLWIHGIPGAGKTVLASGMVEKVKGFDAGDRTKKTAAAYYYCHHGRNMDEATPFLKWILSQFCRKSGYIPQGLRDLHESGLEPTTQALLDCLEVMLGQFQRAYVVLDAVDESSPLSKLLKLLVALGTEQRFAKLRLVVTSREYADVESSFQGVSIPLGMNNPGVREDIATFTDSSLKDDPYKRWPADLRGKVATAVNAKSHGMFRYAACLLELLGDCANPAEVERDLKVMPKTLNEIYELILHKIEARSRSDAVRALALVMASMDLSGAIHMNTLVTAVAGGPGQQSFLDMDRLRRACVCLLRVRDDGSVYLAHYTVREFLQSKYVHDRMPPFYLPTRAVNDIYYEAIMRTAVQTTTVPQSSNVPEYKNGDPKDYNHWALRQTRIALYWARDDLGWKPENRKLLYQVMDPYGASFPALKIMGSDGHHDTSHQTTFEWVPRWSGKAENGQKADNGQKAASHLAMLVSLRNLDIINDFLGRMSERDRVALFNTQMMVYFPLRWESFSKNGLYDSKPSSVTILQFYQEGQTRGYDTSEELKFLNRHLRNYVQPGGAAAAPAPTTSSTKLNPPSSSNSRPRSPGLAPPPASQSQRASDNSRGSGAISPGVSRAGHVSKRTTATTSSTGNPSASTSNTSSTNTSRRTVAPPPPQQPRQSQQQAPAVRTVRRTQGTENSASTSGNSSNTTTR